MLHTDDFKNRFQKVYRHIQKWAKRNNITCYRIYDWDIPNFPLVVDRYEDYIHISEYKSNHNLDEDAFKIWWESCIQIVSEITQIPLENIYTKQRRRIDRKTDQYNKFASAQKIITVQENNLNFKINLTDYLDTGLFLDHRPLRQIVASQSLGRKVLNLFSYTGSFSVYAAANGAAKVTTVDLSNTYIKWAQENFKLNNLPVDKHEFVVSDVIHFLNNNNEKYDLVIVDPPSFSNSKKFKGTWDTQRDHHYLLQLIARRLHPNSLVYFSNNLRSFQPSFQDLDYSSIQEITQKTIPEDFRNKKIHKSYLLIK